MMQFVMQPGMVYQYPLWWVALLLVGLSALGAVLVDLAVHQFLSIELRRSHNDVAAAIFSVVGVTFAVLLAFVAMLAWDGFNRAKAAAYTEAAAVLDVYNAAIGLTGPQASQMPNAIIGYLETVVRVEWPAQAEGQTVDRGKAFLEKLNTLAIGLKPAGVADGNLHAQLLQSLARLSDARGQGEGGRRRAVALLTSPSHASGVGPPLPLPPKGAERGFLAGFLSVTHCAYTVHFEPGSKKLLQLAGPAERIIRLSESRSSLFANHNERSGRSKKQGR
jgi:hypothetical protein